MLAKIAAEYEKGRLLLIQTTDLDAGRPVLWNIGAIAASGHPGALDLVRHILLASASIPAAFPPVMFDVEANGNHYQEMHVDGGAVSQAFLVPPGVNIHVAQEKAGYRRTGVVAYVIRNSRLKSEWSDVERHTLSIAQKAVSTMINYNGVGDLYRMYLVTQRAGASFNLAYISDDFQAEHKEDFDLALEKRRDRRFVPSTPNSLANQTRVLLAEVERLRAGLEWRRFDPEKGGFGVSNRSAPQVISG